MSVQLTVEQRTPVGYKPATCRECGAVCFWLRESVQPGDRVKAGDALTLELEQPKPSDRIPACRQCGPTPAGGFHIG